MDRETKITRWIDATLDADARRDFEAEMARDAGLRAEAEAARAVGDVLRAGLSADTEPPAPELFNAHIEKRIREGARSENPARNPHGTGGKVTPLPWLRAPWVVAAAACVVAAFALLNRQGPAGPATRTVYSPHANVTAEMYLDNEAGATVLRLGGLDEIPAERDVQPFSVATAGPADNGGGALVFYDAADPAVALFALHIIDGGAPSFHGLGSGPF